MNPSRLKPENREAVSTRWPELLAWLEKAPAPKRCELLTETPVPTLRMEGVQLQGAYHPREEAVLQASLVPPGSKQATVYGFAQGELVRALLRREEVMSVRVMILNRTVARASLAAFDHTDWLVDPRVALVRPVAGDELEVPFAAAPACLRLAGDEATRTRDLVTLELSTPHARRHLRAQAAELRRRVDQNRLLLAEDGRVDELFDTQPGGVIRVAAPGPSLARHYAALSTADTPLIALDAAVKPLLAAGIAPDVVLTMDPHVEGMRRVFEVPEEELADTTLVYFPVVLNEVLVAWPGRRLAVSPEGLLFASGSVVHPAVDLAVRMGARRVELYGADFATPGGKSHVQGSAWQFSFANDRSKPSVLDGRGRRVSSLPNLVGYLRDLERYIARRPEVLFVNASRDGARIAGTVYPEEVRAA